MAFLYHSNAATKLLCTNTTVDHLPSNFATATVALLLLMLLLLCLLLPLFLLL
jgi:hypothetical protein